MAWSIRKNIIEKTVLKSINREENFIRWIKNKIYAPDAESLLPLILFYVKSAEKKTEKKRS